MNVEEIRKARLAEPFVRFALQLDDGRLLPVERPFQLGISPLGKEITYASSEKGFEHFPVTRIVRLQFGILHEKAG